MASSVRSCSMSVMPAASAIWRRPCPISASRQKEIRSRFRFRSSIRYWSFAKSVRQLGRKRGVAKAEAALRILPQPFFFMQKANGAGHVIELIAGEALGELGKIERRLFDHGRNLFGKLA